MSLDCCIIGGGIIGLSIARELAGRGHRLRVLARERRRDTAKDTGVMGNPHVASAAKGGQLFAAVVAKLVQLATEMHAAPVRHYKDFGSHCP